MQSALPSFAPEKQTGCCQGSTSCTSGSPTRFPELSACKENKSKLGELGGAESAVLASALDFAKLAPLSRCSPETTRRRLRQKGPPSPDSPWSFGAEMPSVRSCLKSQSRSPKLRSDSLHSLSSEVPVLQDLSPHKVDVLSAAAFQKKVVVHIAFGLSAARLIFCKAALFSRPPWTSAQSKRAW